MFDYLFTKLKDKIDSLITQRILMFHKAMAEREQIPPIKPDHSPVREDAS